MKLDCKELLERLPSFDYEAEPVSKTIDYTNPYDYFQKVSSGKEGEVLLDGGAEIDKQGRFSFVLTEPLFVVRVVSGLAEFRFLNAGFTVKADPPEIISFIESLLPSNNRDEESFNGGALFLLPYELGGFYEEVDGLSSDGQAQLWCGFYPDVTIFDNQFKTTRRVCRRELEEKTGGIKDSKSFILSNLECLESKASYIKKIEKVKRYIEEGDVYQVNLSRELEASFTGNPLSLYGRLRDINPSSYGAYLNGGDFQFLSMSPELFFSSSKREIKTKPIKGTSPRYADKVMDEKSKNDLINSEKDNAENLMIVDLMRNDLSKICEPNSVTVPELSVAQTLPTLYHLVSTITGELKEGVTLSQILRAIFPAGSITGAPKIRAMEIIAELESGVRGFYCGSLVTLGFNGTATGSVLIRSITIKNKKAIYRTGGGITSDSIPENEFEETELKAKAFEMAVMKEVGNA